MSDPNKNDKVRYTAVLPVEHVKELKELVQEAQIPSVNKGILMAVEDYIKAQKKLIYEQKMREAAKDDAYLNRIAHAQDDFALIDKEEIKGLPGRNFQPRWVIF